MRLKLPRSVIGPFLVTLFISFPSHAAETDFDKVCRYFQQLEQLADVNSMTHQQRNTFILDKITNNLPISSNARAAWEGISYADANQRYELFKSAAESVINVPWSCTAMEKLAAKTGEF